jgi:hypothetical protein
VASVTEKDFINIAESAVKTYIESVFSGNALVEVRVGFPNFTDKTPLQKIYVTVDLEDSDFSASGYDNMLDVDKSNGGKVETRGNMVSATFGVDVWSSRGDSKNPSKSGGKAGGKRYFSSVTRAFTTDEDDFYALYPDADIESFSHKYNRAPENFDAADIYQVHGELQLSFPIEAI